MIKVREVEVKLTVIASNSADDKDCEIAQKSMVEEEQSSLSLREGAKEILSGSAVSLSCDYPTSYKIEVVKEKV